VICTGRKRPADELISQGARADKFVSPGDKADDVGHDDDDDEEDGDAVHLAAGTRVFSVVVSEAPPAETLILNGLLVSARCQLEENNELGPFLVQPEENVYPAEETMERVRKRLLPSHDANGRQRESCGS